MKINETEVKYLAGLIDADGCFGFEFTNNRLYLALSLVAADSIDKDNYVFNLPQTINCGTSCKKERNGTNWSQVSVWKVVKAKDIEMLFPRLIKHMIIKGRHAQRMLDLWQKYRGVILTDTEIEQIKVYSKASRLDAGSVKKKLYPTWAWIAGYLDGDGSYIFKQPPSQKAPRALVQATAHENDKVALEMLYHTFGGTLNNRGETAPHIWDWKHALGSSNKSFAVRFLPKVLRHSKFKKHKIEMLLQNCHISTRTD